MTTHNQVSLCFTTLGTPLGGIRIIANWFIASERNCYLTQSFCERINRYYAENYFSNQHTRAGRYLAKNLPRIPRKLGCRTDFLVSYLVRKILKISPYFAFNYLFAHHIGRDKICKNIYHEMPNVLSDHPLLLAKLSRENAEISEVRAAIADVVFSPLYKLNWKEDIFKKEWLNEQEYLCKILEV